ncbi:hypothetical protein VKT23_003537 [Stygiomarasmius scandens]|uniref:Uncharacterized protein n=1 Tax=Marasmiellus scandens TaxID=2682957 RepID=A0ABR1JZ92_9AGAR
MSEGASSSSTISAPSSTTSQALPPTPTSPTSLRPGTNYTLSPDDPSITYSPFNSSWTPAPQENLPICAKNTSTRSTTQQNAKISFNTTGTRVFVRTVNSPQGGTFGNKTQNFTSHSDTPSCDSSPGLQTLLQNTHVLAISGGDLQQVVITNGESAFTFIDIIVSQDAEGPMVSSQNTADSVPRSTLFNVLSLLFLECLSLALI